MYRFALSDRSGTQAIRVPYIDGKRFDTRATLNAHEEAGQTGFDEIRIAFHSLDGLAKRLRLEAISLVKIDVEGHEGEVLDGALETLRRFRPLVLVEIEARHHDKPIETVFDLLLAIGFRGYYVDPVRFELRDVAAFDVGRDQRTEDLDRKAYFRYLNNFFFVHEGQEAGFVKRARGFLAREKALVARASGA